MTSTPRLALFLCLSALAGCAPGPSTEGMSGVEEEARRFMTGYAADMQSQNRHGLAARYHRQGAHWMLPGQKRFPGLTGASLGLPLLVLPGSVVGWPAVAGVNRWRRRERVVRTPFERRAHWL